jgi:hypothetical protein
MTKLYAGGLQQREAPETFSQRSFHHIISAVSFFVQSREVSGAIWTLLTQIR